MTDTIEDRARPYTETIDVALCNALKNGTNFADYVYDMCCEWMGEDHKRWSVLLISAALQAERADMREKAAKIAVEFVALEGFRTVKEAEIARTIAREIRSLD